MKSLKESLLEARIESYTLDELEEYKEIVLIFDSEMVGIYDFTEPEWVESKYAKYISSTDQHHVSEKHASYKELKDKIINSFKGQPGRECYIVYNDNQKLIDGISSRVLTAVGERNYTNAYNTIFGFIKKNNVKTERIEIEDLL